MTTPASPSASGSTSGSAKRSKPRPRARHLHYRSGGRWADDPRSDLARIRRDHTFLGIFVPTAQAQVTNAIRLNAFVGGLLNQVTVDTGLKIKTFLALFRGYRHVDSNTVPETTLPITVVPNYHNGAGAYGGVTCRSSRWTIRSSPPGPARRSSAMG